MSKLTKAVFINRLIDVAERVDALSEIGKSKDNYADEVQICARSHGIFVGDAFGLSNPIVYCIERLVRIPFHSPTPRSLARHLARIEAAWEYYEKYAKK